MYAGCVRFCPADSALGVTGGFVTGAAIQEIQTQTLNPMEDRRRREQSVCGERAGYLRAVMTILCDLLAYTGSVSALKPAATQTHG